MEKTLTIDGRDVKFEATAGTPRRYRRDFGRDFMIDFQKLQKELGDKAAGVGDLSVEALTIFENVAYTMAKQADPEHIPATADAWLDSFEMFSIYLILPEIIELWNLQSVPTVESKKKA